VSVHRWRACVGVKLQTTRNSVNIIY